MHRMKIHMHRIRALINKEFLQIIRDPSNIMIAFVLPFILMMLFGCALSLDNNKISIAIVINENSNSHLNSLVESFSRSKYFHPLAITYDKNDALSLMLKNKIRGIIVIPENFTKNFIKEENENLIQVITDGAETNTANFIARYAQAIWLSWLNEHKNTSDKILIETEPRFLYNQELNSSYFLIPGSIAIILTMIGTVLTALVVSKEWERGTMEGIISLPVQISEIIISKLIPYLILGLGSVSFCLILALFVFRIPFVGSTWVLFLVSTAYLCNALGVGLLISTIAKSQFVASQMAIIAGFLPSFMLSGFLFEVNSMPKVIELISYLIPAKYFIICLRTIFLSGDIWTVILPNLLIIGAFATVLLTISVLRTKKKIE